MTQTTERQLSARPRPGRGPRPIPVGPGLTVAVWAAGAGLVALAVPVLLAWATDSRSGSGATAALQSAGQLWVLAHGGSLAVPGGTLGLTPLGLVVLPLVLLSRAGAHAARTAAPRDLPADLVLTAAIGTPYAVLVAVVAAAAASTDIRPAPVQALLAGLFVGLLGAGVGVARGTGRWRGLLASVPARIRTVAWATSVALGLLLGAGALLAGGALAAHVGRAGELARASDPGLFGGLALLALGLVLVPNLVVWGASWWAGPGFAVGAGTTIGPFGATLGAVPALPVLAALPAGAPPTWLAALALAVPVVAGGFAGLLVARRRVMTSPLLAAREAVCVGPCTGLVLAVLAFASGGPLGGERLAQVGPSPWRVALAVTLEVAVAAGLAAAAAVWRNDRKTPKAVVQSPRSSS